MKANKARVIKLQADLERADHLRQKKELEEQRKKIATQARLERQKNLAQFENKRSLLESDFLLIKKAIVEALTEGKDYITFNQKFASSISKNIKLANELGSLLEERRIVLPPVLCSFNSKNGYGVFNPKDFVNSHSQDLKKIQFQISKTDENKFQNLLKEIVYKALDQYDPDQHKSINAIDESIILDFQKKIIHGIDLQEGEMTFVVSVLKGDLESFYQSQKQELLQTLSYKKSLLTQFQNLQEKFNFFNRLALEDDYVLCWSTDQLWSKLFENTPYIQSPLINAPIGKINSNNHNILENIALLNWASNLVFENFYDECFKFISHCAEEGFDSCLVNIKGNGLILNQGRKRKVVTFENPIPISKQPAIFTFWQEFFELLDYRPEFLNSTSTLHISWS